MGLTEDGLGLVQPDDESILSIEEQLDHDDPAHECHRGCCDWEDPDWPESCGDED
jgi:hypothetical protein